MLFYVLTELCLNFKKNSIQCRISIKPISDKDNNRLVMDNFIHEIRQRAKSQLKRIVLPESDDPRIKEAARIAEEQGIAQILLLSPEMIDACTKERFAQELSGLSKSKNITLQKARELLSNPLYYAAMMVRDNSADGFVAGASHTTSDVIRTTIHCLDIHSQLKIVSSCFIMLLPDSSWGENGVFIFADCGVIPQPDTRQLACIAILTAELAEEILAVPPRIALLSYSTRGSAKGKTINKVSEAVELIRQMKPGLLVDGELQADAAIIPDVAKAKHADAILGGRANVLIFPDLNTGNISYKLVQRLANARAVGPLILGLSHPCSDLSRGCLVEDIVDCIAVTAVRAQYYK